MMNTELPKIDLPEEWVIGTDIDKELLSLYTNYPCRLKAEMFVLCMDGEIEASVNLNRITVHANDFIAISPGSILQIHRVNGEPKLYFGGFSSKFIEQASRNLPTINTIFIALGKPIIPLKPEEAKLMEEYFLFLIKVHSFFDEPVRKGIAIHLYSDIHAGMMTLYNNRNTNNKERLSKSELIYKNFTQLVIQHYNQTRNVGWYAQKLGMSHAHLCTTVKQVTGYTCVEIISRMVIMDAKSQLKSTHISIQAISDSLNFANMSFFGKYFKRYTGMSPLTYRNNV